MPAPARPLIYHITHVDTLSRIVADGALWSDAVMAARGGPAVTIGMSAIKLRRLRELPVKCHPGDYVGEYVPFYFCPRSWSLVSCVGVHSDAMQQQATQALEGAAHCPPVVVRRDWYF